MPGPEGLIIAIDGVVGAGKSTTARGVAAALGYRHVDTGAMYRAVTLAAMRENVQAEDAEALSRLLRDLRIELEAAGEGGRVFLNGDEVSDEIRRPEVARRVGAYADVTQVRRALVERQRSMGADGGIVADGRDVGTVIFPAADLKVQLTADPEERAQRRYRELIEKGVSTTLEQVRTDIRTRDREDGTRDYLVAGVGVEPESNAGHEVGVRRLDSSGLTLAQVVDRIVSWARDLGADVEG